jgi:hypothetical protein
MVDIQNPAHLSRVFVCAGIGATTVPTASGYERTMSFSSSECHIFVK